MPPKTSDDNEVRLGHPAGHFYSPIVDPREIKASAFSNTLSERDLSAVNISVAKIRDFWEKNRNIITSCAFPDVKTPGARYYKNNPVFNQQDAMLLRAMIKIFEPRRIIEIGSGFSSAVILDTVESDHIKTEDIVFIDPFADRLKALIGGETSSNVRAFEQKVQDVDINIFDDLDDNDILFIDSSHVLKAQSDVCFEFFEILPRLKPGVLIHFHDIFYPFEYPKEWILERRYSWNELYALRLFLAHNHNYETVFFNNLFGRLCQDLTSRDWPEFNTKPGGSFWMRKLK